MEISPCSSIHTFFMRFPINIIFVDKENIIVDFRFNIKPWNMLFAKSPRAYKTLEMSYKGNEKIQIARGKKVLLIHDENCDKILL